jgi:hypothetical protein
MKKQILIIVLIGIMSMTFNSLMAQERPERRPQQEQASTLTKAQIQSVNDILADYDSEAVTEANAKAIMKSLKEAKIPGGKGIEKAITDAGFDFKEIRKLAPPPSRPNNRPEKR